MNEGGFPALLFFCLIYAWILNKAEGDLLAFHLKTYNKIHRRRTGESEIIHKFLYIQG